MGGCRISSMEKNCPTLFVDADSCPVKEEIAQLASDFSVAAIFVASHAHYTSRELYLEWEWKYVDSDREAADLYIMNHTSKGDIVVTQDIGLASTLLLKGVYVLSPKGILFEEKDIQTALDIRYIKKKARARGIYGKGPAPYTELERNRFAEKLAEVLSVCAGRGLHGGQER
ncbi:DUF188 domain-containing protein [Neobacillus piezotolerans]|uniref:UPF0178 protein DRW41_18300 n=1 Tax=Neobacillus piezotolerans TaxID=2259171 RepID=A0A3D8GLY0_9BACI|nr:DUF188 domain-containing protein [Neobacillus piezotolerans]RDU35408.1 DUF188 domain-containing protein [Neobacillus piezotolerans]